MVGNDIADYFDNMGNSKGGKPNIEAGGFTKNSPIETIKTALDELKKQYNDLKGKCSKEVKRLLPGINALAGLLKVVKWGGSMLWPFFTAFDAWTETLPSNTNPMDYYKNVH